MEDKYAYIFTYTRNGTTTTMTVPGMITLTELHDRLFEFLCGCGWDRDSLKHIAKGGDLYNPGEEDEDDCAGYRD